MELSKSELKKQYKEKPKVGGVYCITCTGSGRKWVRSTPNIEGQKNRFDFSVITGSCMEPGMDAEWRQYGAQAFTFSVLERLEQKETQTAAEFSADLATLLEMLKEKNSAT